VDDRSRILTADGFLSVDGKLIYQMNNFTVKMEDSEDRSQNKPSNSGSLLNSDS